MSKSENPIELEEYAKEELKARKEAFLEARTQFTEVAKDLLEAWMYLDGDFAAVKYPFDKDFDQIVTDIIKWNLNKENGYKF